MRILLSTTSGIGHLHPLVPLALAAQRSGHVITVAAPRSLGRILAERELPHLPLPDYGPAHLAKIEQVMTSLPPPGPGTEVAMLRDVFGWAKTDSTLAAMVQAVQAWRPDLVVHEAMELSGPLAAEQAGIPHAAVAMALRDTIVGVAPLLAEGTAALARDLGLPHDEAGRRILGIPYLSMVPPSLDRPRTAGIECTRPDTTLRYRLTALHRGDSVDLDLRGPGPLVWIALGTEAWRIPPIAERLAPLLDATAAALPTVRFLLTTGSHGSAVAAMPANVLVRDYVPQEQALAACSAVLGHGGFNTTMATLASGRPLAAMPLFSTDQFETTARLAEMEAAVPIMDPTPQRLADALRACLEGTAATPVITALAAEMAGLPDPAATLDALLERTVQIPAAAEPGR